MSWDNVFEDTTPEPPASEEEIAYLQESALAPLSESEIAQVNASQRNPFPKSDPFHAQYRPFDPGLWRIPQRPFPESFVELLRWSNGGCFVNGDREMGIFDPKGIREYLLAYHVPEYMPGAVPFALDGGGGFYLFDMREEPVDGEYPIVFSRSGNLGWGDAHCVIATTFREACQGTTDPNEEL